MNIYQENYKKELEERQQWMDQEAWLHGQYHLAALGAALSKRCKYPDQPMSVKHAEQSQLSQEEKFILWADEFNRRYGAKYEEGEDGEKNEV